MIFLLCLCYFSCLFAMPIWCLHWVFPSLLRCILALTFFLFLPLFPAYDSVNAAFFSSSHTGPLLIHLFNDKLSDLLIFNLKWFSSSIKISVKFLLTVCLCFLMLITNSNARAFGWAWFPPSSQHSPRLSSLALASLGNKTERRFPRSCNCLQFPRLLFTEPPIPRAPRRWRGAEFQGKLSDPVPRVQDGRSCGVDPSKPHTSGEDTADLQYQVSITFPTAVLKQRLSPGSASEAQIPQEESRLRPRVQALPRPRDTTFGSD